MPPTDSMTRSETPPSRHDVAPGAPFALGSPIRVIEPASSLCGRRGVVVGHVDGDELVRLDGEERALRFGRGEIEVCT